MCGGRAQNDVCRASNSFVDCSQFPKRCVVTLKKTLSPGLYLFVGTVVVLPRLACSSFSKTGRIFRANIVSVGDVASGVFGFGVIR